MESTSTLDVNGKDAFGWCFEHFRLIVSDAPRFAVRTPTKMPSAILNFFKPSPLKNSILTDWEFVETGPGAPREVEHAKEQTVANWPTHDMRAFLGDQRQWGAWILENDKLCRTMVATMLVAQEQTGVLAEDDAEATSEPQHKRLPFMGEKRPKGQDWLAPLVVSALIGQRVRVDGPCPGSPRWWPAFEQLTRSWPRSREQPLLLV